MFTPKHTDEHEKLDAAVREYSAVTDELDTPGENRTVVEWALVVATQRIDEDGDILTGYFPVASSGAMLHTQTGLLSRGIDELEGLAFDSGSMD